MGVSVVSISVALCWTAMKTEAKGAVACKIEDLYQYIGSPKFLQTYLNQ